MTAVLISPSLVCHHSEQTHCDFCIAELVLPSLRVVRTSWRVMRAVST